MSITEGTNTITKISIGNINEGTLWAAKIYAAQTKQALREVVTEALVRLVYEEGEEDRP